MSTFKSRYSALKFTKKHCSKTLTFPDSQGHISVTKAKIHAKLGIRHANIIHNSN